ncbi:MAG TPA: hypothetical protein PKA28_09150 [Methylomusa anaerophila]|uniref:hypothetical protein n=1 Tax=Methylomusa anaerophila TaxID=1930071 RepID=UPI000F8458D4|nr:hypothetical protein [Methylomusa anaerophila]HML88603.1 hypothetical protein [Methylomusa anaerophila]
MAVKKGAWIKVTNEEFQKLVLEKLVSLESSIKDLEQGQNSLVQSQNSLVQGQSSLVQGQNSLVQGQTEILAEIKNLKEADAALLDLVEKTYHETEKISRLEAKLDALNDRTFEHEADIRLLKKAK